MTKEDILDKHKIFLGSDEPRYPPELLKAMDDYAKQIMIAALKWYSDTDYYLDESDKKCWRSSARGNTSRLSNDELYAKFLEDKNKQS